MSKMREALNEVYEAAWRNVFAGINSPNEVRLKIGILDEIAQRYGDLEFTREEVRGMLEEAAKKGVSLTGRNLVQSTAKQFASEILSRHLGESESGEQCPNPRCQSFGCAKCDDTPTIKASEIEAVTGEKVPEWARWAARQGDTGRVICFEERPIKFDRYWGGNFPKQVFDLVRNHPIIPGPWQDSLRRIVHDEPEEEPDIYDAVLDYRTREGMATLDDLCKRLAAIEKRVLADGHSRKCEYAVYLHGECTCGHDKIRENAK